MNRLAFLAAVFVVAVLAIPVAAREGNDSATLAGSSGLVGQQFELTLEISTPSGATVEVDPANESWAGVEVVELVSTVSEPAGDGLRHTVVVLVAVFEPASFEFRPAVNVVEGTTVTGRVLQPLTLSATRLLLPGDPLELTPLPPPTSIRGAQSPFLVPAVIASIAAAVLLAGAGLFFLGRWLLRPRPRAEPVAVPIPANPDLAYAESLLDADPPGAYRHMAATVRAVLARRYGFPARALTTTELESRMSSAGVDRWQARLVSGLLSECDAVVYAGYRPAAERRHADLAMAQQIVEGEA